MNKKIITISREFGSGGRTVGKQLADKLGVPCFDHELILKLVEKSGLSEEYIKEESEYAHGGFLTVMLSSREMGLTNQDILWTAQRNIILEIAEKESCVIVGRCADFILRDKEKTFNVFIHASMEKRAERIVQQYGEREESPVQRLKEKDKKRAAYYRFYTDTKWGVAQNYHVALDSGALGIQYCVELLADMVEEFYKRI